MKTYNYNIELMTPMQTDKEIIFNEAQNIIDSFCNYVINDFISQIPTQIILGDKYILKQGELKNFICYCSSLAKSWQFLLPKNGMIIFVKLQKAFFMYDNDQWSKIELLTNNVDDNFKSIEGDCELEGMNRTHFYLYMNNDCSLNLNNIKVKEFLIFIKQNIHEAYQLKWVNNIIWLRNNTHQLTQDVNKIDIIKFYRIAEVNDLFGEIIGQNY